MKCFAVQLTGPGMGAIGVALVVGPDAAGLLARMTGSADLSPGQVRPVRLLHPADGAVVDDAVLVCIGEERFEVHVHGGVAVMKGVLAALRDGGAEVLSVEEAHRAGLFGRGIRGELMLALPRARTTTSLELLLAQTEQGLAAWAGRWLAAIDGAPIWPLHSAGQWLLSRSSTLARLIEPARIAILGPPNAGKSTLANALLGRDVSITSDLAGTTRDWVDAAAVFRAEGSGNGPVEVPVILVDTAGIREPADTLEEESIARTHAQAASADVILLVFDASRSPTEQELALIDACAAKAPTVVGFNKMDVEGAPAREFAGMRGVGISARSHGGLDQLMEAVLVQLDLARVEPGEAFAFTARQREILEAVAISNDRVRMGELLRALIDG